jgi:hypothetical protein
MPQGKGTYGNKIGRPSKKNKEFMLTYGNPGDNAKVIYKDSLEELQKKAQELRKKNFIIEKFGRTQPLSELRKKIQTKEEIKEDWKKFDKELESLNKIELDRIKTENKLELLRNTVDDAEDNNEHGKVAEIVTKLYGTPEEQRQIKKINDKQEKNNDISKEDFAKRTKISSKYYYKLMDRKKVFFIDKERFDKINQSVDLIGKPETQAKKSESKQEFNKISQSFDLIGKPTKLTRPGYAGGGKNRRR